MARFPSYLSYFFCVATAAVGRNQNKKQKNLLWSHICHNDHMECVYNLVDMERFRDRGIDGFLCKQSPDVFPLAGLQDRQEQAW